MATLKSRVRASSGKPEIVKILPPRLYKNKDGTISEYPCFRYTDPLTGNYVFRQFKDRHELHAERSKIDANCRRALTSR